MIESYACLGTIEMRVIPIPSRDFQALPARLQDEPSSRPTARRAKRRSRERGTTVKRLSIGVLLAASVLLLPVSPAAADPPTEITVEESGEDLNVCTGEPQTVTFNVTFFVHEHDGRITARGERTITTTAGFAGRGTSSFVLNDQVEMFRFTDILANDAGDRIRAQGVFVFSNDTVKVDKFELRCLGG
jgi:hypothetical protein